MNKLKGLNKIRIIDRLKKVDYTINHELKKSLYSAMKINDEIKKVETKLENIVSDTKKPIGGFNLNTKYFKNNNEPQQIRNMKYIQF